MPGLGLHYLLFQDVWKGISRRLYLVAEYSTYLAINGEYELSMRLWGTIERILLEAEYSRDIKLLGTFSTDKEYEGSM